RAGLLHGERALAHAHLAVAVAGGAVDRRGTRFRAAAVAGLAGDRGGNADAHAGAAYRLFQAEVEGVAEVGAALNVAAAAGAAVVRAAGAPLHVHAIVAELVVGRPLLRVRQHVVSLVRLLEALFRLRVARVAVRVVLHRHPPVGLLQLLLGSIAGHTQLFVVI